jgi:hypothetical protein
MILFFQMLWNWSAIELILVRFWVGGLAPPSRTVLLKFFETEDLSPDLGFGGA